jgi:hypoxanthine-guanine phosphoribosyltransferase
MGLKIPVKGRNILIVDDILETGRTIHKLVE